MYDRIPTPGQEGRMLISPEGGTPYYATVAMADNPTQEGTFINKATLLKDATAALFGLGAAAVPDDVHNWVGQYNNHWWSVLNTSTGSTTYVNSTNRNAYPDDATEGNLTYRYLGIPFDNAVKAPKLETGSYVGTGVSGESDPNSLNFDFDPSVLIILYKGIMSDSSGYSYSMIATKTRTSVVVTWGADGSDTSGYRTTATNKFTFNGKQVSWYVKKDANWTNYYEAQFNEGGSTYHYIALG